MKPIAISTKTPLVLCGACGYEMDAATGPCQPSGGDLTLCVRCGAAHRFTDSLEIVLLEEDELAALPSKVRARITSVQDAIRSYRR